MNDREKEIVRKALGDKPKERLTNAGWMLKAVDAIRDIAVGTMAEVYRFLAATNEAITDSQIIQWQCHQIRCRQSLRKG